MTHFDALVQAYLDEAFRLDPIAANAAGIHDHDHAWPDLSDAGRQSVIRSVETWRRTFGALDDASLTFDQQIDRDRLLQVLEARHHALSDEQERAWDPLAWIHLIGNGLFGLLAREFAPLEERLVSVAARLEGVPAVIDAACATLGSVPERPVSAFHTERALLDIAGIPNLVQEALGLAETLPPSPGTSALRLRLDDAAAVALAATERFEIFLRVEMLPGAAGDGRLGAARFGAKLGHTIGDPEMTVGHILGEAERLFTLIRAEMARLAGQFWGQLEPAVEPPGDPVALTRTVLARVGDDHCGPDELLDVCREALARIQAFCRARNVIGLSDEPLEIRWTPLFMRGQAQAMLSSPGPFETGQKAFYLITPVPDGWPPSLVESHLREMNRHQLEVLTIHEAVPGHYLQGVYGNLAASRVRTVHSSGVYDEGWAVYVTQVMMDAGYADGNLRLQLAHWKYYLRAIVNAILDIRIHTGDMTEAEALDLMVQGGFQELAEAKAKFSRARLTSTQLCTYFVGSLSFWELEHEARRRAAAEAGAPDAVPIPAIIGGYPDTPAFAYRPYLESLISQGSLSMPLLRRAILERS